MNHLHQCWHNWRKQWSMVKWACKWDANFCWYALSDVYCSCTTDGAFDCILLLLLLSGSSHRFVSESLLPSIINLLRFITCTSFFEKFTLQPASKRTGTEISVFHILLNPCPFCALGGKLGYKLSYCVVSVYINISLAHNTRFSSWGSVSPKYWWCLARNMPISAVLE